MTDFDPLDPLAEERLAGGAVLSRSDSGNPMIVPRGEIVPVEYERASNLASYLVHDIRHLVTWEKRHLAIALGRYPDIAALCAVEGYNTGLGLLNPILAPGENRASGKRVDYQIERALDRYGIHEKADAGTVAHAVTDPRYTGPPVPLPVVKEAVDAIHELTAALEAVATEFFVASDAFKSAGTCDHAYYIADQALARELGEALGHDLTGVLIGDKKTGKSVRIGEFEIQVGGTYAHGEVYLGPPEDGEHQRIPLEDYFGGPVNRTTGLLVHASTTGTPRPRVLPLDLQRGRALARMAAVTRDARMALDKIGTPKKLNMDLLAKRTLEGLWEELCSEERQLTHTQFRARSSALWARFKHVWPEEYTFAIKERLS